MINSSQIYIIRENFPTFPNLYIRASLHINFGIDIDKNKSVKELKKVIKLYLDENNLLLQKADIFTSLNIIKIWNYQRIVFIFSCIHLFEGEIAHKLSETESGDKNYSAYKTGFDYRRQIGDKA
ncbi:hypothetical protein RIR_jg31202.t2 [Rhizophagus irregularis DAOM 181602=DAOM 197198]|nr:hypothetical protein RIR_jg31202.t2 [Rhizophagus irregularis DAOM 181602=DAOM 197198]